jgi:hypothetical protein
MVPSRIPARNSSPDILGRCSSPTRGSVQLKVSARSADPLASMDVLLFDRPALNSLSLMPEVMHGWR